ncbi:MAG: hypothetical protein RBS68_10940 [Anaerolineales bacterium]|nr:hypothetical protein [Anaerolineales bacterium]
MSEEIRQISPPPIHPLAALATIALDGIFFFFFIEAINPLAALAIGALGFATTTLVQRFLDNDEWGPAIAKGLALGIVAGVPYPVAGTAVGLPLLAWAGVSRWMQPKQRPNNQILDEALQRPRLGKGGDE